MKRIFHNIFNYKWLLCATLATSTMSCSDYLDKEPMSEYLSSDFYRTEGAVKQGTTGCYQMIYQNLEKFSNIPMMILWDMYTPFGIERGDNNSIGVGNLEMTNNFTVEYAWATLYTSVARCNTVLAGAEPFMGELNDKSHQYLAEVRTLRAYYYLHLVSLFGDIPFFTAPVTDAQLKFVERTPWQDVVDFLLADLEDASTYMPWVQTEMGRVDKSVALGIKSRLALYAGSWCKFGHGKDAIKDEPKGLVYFAVAADAADRVINQSGRYLGASYDALFSRLGQLSADSKAENMFNMMFSDQGAKKTHYMSAGEQCRMVGQSGRFPTQQLVDVFEMANGKRIDDPTSGYDPTKPFASRDPRLKKSIYVHHDTIIGNSGKSTMKFLMEVYNPKTKSFDEEGNAKLIDNLDYAGSVAQYGYVQSGVGFLWKKYNHFNDESTFFPSYNIVLMRFAEMYLNYAEAKIELGQMDATVVDAINKVRARVGMPDILSIDPSRAGDQLKMRQIVRRERKVEFVKENLALFDMRRWRTGQLQNSQATYGYPLAKGVDAAKGVYPDGYAQATPDMVPSYGAVGSDRDINDIADYSAFGDKLRRRDVDRPKGWNDRYYLWPVPQTERNKCPYLQQTPGYGL
ncbi:MAG: RagB/SusD family nutrient uptake outer membrane protein [Bacteroidales bacterium]